ncbi:MAG: thiamine phosphate synthase [Limisphaerales bacterium]
MKPLAHCRLYAFVDAAYLRGREPLAVARDLVRGGADLVQLRAKDWPRERIAATAASLAPVCRDAGVWFVVNDHTDLAAAVGAPLAHLGQEDFFDVGHGAVSDAAPPGVQFGLSSHAPEQARRALAAGAAYIAVGPVHATATKPGRPAVTLEYVRWAAAHLDVPWFAIGGINLENLDAVLAAGARRVCVVGAILNAPDVAAACREFRRRLDATPAKNV